MRRCLAGRTLPRFQVAAGTGAFLGGLGFLGRFWLDRPAAGGSCGTRPGYGVVHHGVYPPGVHRAGRITKTEILTFQGPWPPSDLQPAVEERREVVPSGQSPNARDP